MSVAQLTAQELGCFVAIAHKHLKAGAIGELCQLASMASAGNAGAFSAQYGEPMEPESPESIERVALEYLAERRDMVKTHFGPIGYNMIANDGSAFAAPAVEIKQDADILTVLRNLEDRAHKWQDGERRKAERAEQNAVAYNDVGQLPVLTRAEIESKMKAAGAERVIIAQFCVDESDSQSDYYGGRTGRTVVIGFGKGKRENFRQLRAAAGRFPPTAKMGPGRDIYKPRVVLLDDVVSNGTAYWHGTLSHWHHELDRNVQFATEAEAQAYIAEKGEPHPIGFDKTTVRFGWEVLHDSYEQRENYSMGGGNYLGTSRYGGWKVKSYAKPGLDRYEFFC